MADAKRVAIVGAGITGLACAAALRGHARVVLVDRIPVAGGVHGWQTVETAETFPSYLKIATRSPERQTMRARFSGMSATAQESTNPFSAGDEVTRL